MDTASYEYWAKIEEMGSPFNNEPITEDSVFLWEEITSPMTPEFFHVGEWGIFPDAKSLGGYILHKYFYFAFENWLVRGEWDPNHEADIDIKELLRRAKELGKCRYAGDIPLMEKLVKLSDEALGNQEGRSLFDSLKTISSIFNDKWKSTGTWSFSIMLYDEVKGVGSEIGSRYEDEEFMEMFDISKKKWQHIYSNISDKKNQHELKKVLQSVSG